MKTCFASFQNVRHPAFRAFLPGALIFFFAINPLPKPMLNAVEESPAKRRPDKAFYDKLKSIGDDLNNVELKRETCGEHLRSLKLLEESFEIPWEWSVHFNYYAGLCAYRSGDAELSKSRYLKGIENAKTPEDARLIKLKLYDTLALLGNTEGMKKLSDEFALDKTLVKEGWVKLFERRALALDWLGKEAPEFKAAIQDDKEISRQNLKGKISVILFWNANSEICQKNLKDVISSLAVFKGDTKFQILSFGQANSKLDYQNFLTKNALEENICVYDVEPEKSKFFKIFGVDSVPLAILTDTEGNIRYREFPLDNRIDDALHCLLKTANATDKK